MPEVLFGPEWQSVRPRSPIAIYCCLIAAAAFMPAARAGELPSPEQIESIVTATRDSILSIEQDLSYTKRLVPSGTDPLAQPIQSEGRVVVRRAGELGFHSQDNTDYTLDMKGGVAGKEHKVISRASNRQWLKSLDQSPQLGAVVGTIERLRPEEEAFKGWWTPERAAYYAFDFMHGMFTPERTTVALGENGNYVVQITEEGRRVDYEIDPSKNFVPVKTVIYDTTKVPAVPISRFECSGFTRLAEGIWLPVDYEVSILWEATEEGETYLYEKWHANKIVVNQPIDRKDLDIVFPRGTHVRDRFAQLRYTVEDEAQMLGNLVKPSTDLAVITQRSATDKELASVHLDDSQYKRAKSLVTGQRRYFFGPLQAVALLAGLVATVLLLMIVRRQRAKRNG